MPEYRRAYVPGGSFFLTLVTYHRTPLFSDPENISHLRRAIAKTRTERPFEITGAVVLPDHIHFLWTLPPNDPDYSQRIARLKILFTRSLTGRRSLPQNLLDSCRKHRVVRWALPKLLNFMGTTSLWQCPPYSCL